MIVFYDMACFYICISLVQHLLTIIPTPLLSILSSTGRITIVIGSLPPRIRSLCNELVEMSIILQESHILHDLLLPLILLLPYPDTSLSNDQ